MRKASNGSTLRNGKGRSGAVRKVGAETGATPARAELSCLTAVMQGGSLLSLSGQLLQPIVKCRGHLIELLLVSTRLWRRPVVRRCVLQEWRPCDTPQMATSATLSL